MFSIQKAVKYYYYINLGDEKTLPHLINQFIILNNLQPVLELTLVADASCPAWISVAVSPALTLAAAHGERGPKWGVCPSPEPRTSNQPFPGARANGK